MTVHKYSSIHALSTNYMLYTCIKERSIDHRGLKMQQRRKATCLNMCWSIRQGGPGWSRAVWEEKTPAQTHAALKSKIPFQLWNPLWPHAVLTLPDLMTSLMYVLPPSFQQVSSMRTGTLVCSVHYSADPRTMPRTRWNSGQYSPSLTTSKDNCHSSPVPFHSLYHGLKSPFLLKSVCLFLFLFFSSLLNRREISQ